MSNRIGERYPEKGSDKMPWDVQNCPKWHVKKRRGGVSTCSYLALVGDIAGKQENSRNWGGRGKITSIFKCMKMHILGKDKGGEYSSTPLASGGFGGDQNKKDNGKQPTSASCHFSVTKK